MKCKYMRLLSCLFSFVISLVYVSPTIAAMAVDESEHFTEFNSSFDDYSKFNFHADNLPGVKNSITKSFTTRNITDVYESIASKSEVCVAKGPDGFYFMSRSNISYFDNSGTYSATFVVNESDSGSTSVNVFETDTGGSYSYRNLVTSNSLYPGTDDIYYYRYYNAGIDGFQILYSDMYAFSSIEYAIDFLRTGNTEHAMAGIGPAPGFDANQIYLEDFRMIVHDSNKLDRYYVDFYFRPSQYLLDNGGQIDIAINSDVEASHLAGAGNFNYIMYDSVETIDLCDFYRLRGEIMWKQPKIYVYDISLTGRIPRVMWEPAILGRELIIDLADFTFEDVGLESGSKITSSKSFLTFKPHVGNIYGIVNNACIDYLHPGDSYTSSSTPDKDGKYTNNNDFKLEDDYFQIDVNADDNGDESIKYYHVDNKGTKVEISKEDNDNNSFNISIDIPDSGGSGGSSGSGGTSGSASGVVNNPIFNNNPTININTGNDKDKLVVEDDDFTDVELRKDLADGFGIFDDVLTPERNDGYISLLNDFLKNIDPDLPQILAFGISMTVGLGIIFIVIKR